MGYCLGFSIPTKAPDALVAVLNFGIVRDILEMISKERSG
jgi:hypothetical protein